MDVAEIRIHGVSGTPPDAMLATDPEVLESRQDGQIQVYAPVQVAAGVRAYRWSSLTSGTVWSALWLALLPFMLCNVAGFALPMLPSGRRRLAGALLRMAGFALTIMFSLITAQGFIDVGAYQYLHRHIGWLTAPQSVGLGGLTAAGLIILGWVELSRRGTTGAVDRVESPHRLTMRDRTFWSRLEIEEDLRLSHLAVALLAIAWIGVDALEQIGADLPAAMTWLVVALAIGVLTVAGIVATGRRAGPLPRMSLYASSGLWVVLALNGTLVDASPGESLTDLSLTRHPIGWTVAVYGLLTIALLAINLSAPDRNSVITAPALLTIAGASGASVGAALIQVSATATGGIPPTWIGSLAAGYLSGILAIGAVTLGMALVLAGVSEGEANRLWTTVRRLRDRLAIVLWTVVAVTALLSTGFIGGRFGWWDFTIPAVIPTWLAALDLALLTTFLYRCGLKRGAAIALIGLLLAAWAASRGMLDRQGAFRWSFDGYEATATTLTILLPLGLIAGRVFGALRNSDQRRGLAVAWDVGSFFPRRHHPFAPPSYGATAVTDLAAFVTEQSETSEAVIVAPHSQGSVIAVAALMLAGPPLEGVALLTFGSPVGSLYRRFFPVWFDDLEEIETSLGGRWVNLFRVDDPIGGPIGGRMDWPAMADPHSRVHGYYWLEDTYRDAVDELTGRLGSER
jgi:hypothetical protein